MCIAVRRPDLVRFVGVGGDGVEIGGWRRDGVVDGWSVGVVEW